MALPVQGFTDTDFWHKFSQQQPHDKVTNIQTFTCSFIGNGQ
jgi:hypothetical protein